MKRTSRDIRTANRYLLLRHVIAASPVSRPALARATGLSPATVATLVGELLELGLLVEAGFEGSGGRPRGLLAVDAAGGALVGVDVAETYVHVEVVDLALRVLGRAHEELTPEDGAPDRAVRRIAGVMRAAMERAAAGRRVLGAGISMPGMVDREGGVSVFAANWDWHEVPLLALLAEHVPYPLYLDNPMRACMVAELWFGAARGRDDAVVVNLGTGVGAGLALGGGVHRGASNSAGEWGHTTLVLDGRPCHCGRRGCVETYVGAPGIMRTVAELDPRGALLGGGDQTAAVDALAGALDSGDPTAEAALRRTAHCLGAAIGDLVNLLDPEVVILTGWVARRLGRRLLDEVRPAVAVHALPRPSAAVEILLSPITANPVSLGAATFALEGALTPAAGARG
ncbi:ROK family protein [Streptomyces sp. 8K308]|uniref:ROK family protein n=1 Tax=Streptomyces sp. 8K308 TaxID=2530388 RepID=UPI00104C2914|nr:ROK family protein [Streptomyces sp. 8K308]TDC21919.1 ROK family protein [Streptomyces sp. 8K308]